MIDRISAFFKQFIKSFNQIKTSQKVILITVFLTMVFFFIFTGLVSSQIEYVYLFKKPLSMKDYGIISSELQKMNEEFKTSDDRFILVKDEETGSRIRMSLAQNNLLPEGIKGWELFDMESWTTTEFDRNIKLRRAIEGEIKRHLENLVWVENAEISIALPEKSLYTERDKDVSAAVTLLPAEGYYDYLKKRKMIMGIKNIIAKGIDGIVLDNIVITDQNGNELSNFAEVDYEKNIKQAIEENKIKDSRIRVIKKQIEEALNGVIAHDRFKVAVEVEMNFNQQSVDQKEILPIIVKEKTPGLAYDDSIVKDTLKVSSKQVNENFEGLGFIPEGPAGVEDNLPPGYKESLDGRNKYSKNEAIDNYINGEKITKHIEDASEIERKSVSVSVDGHWEIVYDESGSYIKENKSIKRKYIPLEDEYLKKIESIVKGAISHDVKRGDIVVVKNIPFDRTEQFKAEDQEALKSETYQKWAFYIIISIILVTFFYFIYRVIEKLIKESIEKKRQENVELARLQREQILNDLENASSTDYSNLKDIDKDFIRLQEEINILVRKQPMDAAKVLSAWLNEKSG